MDNLERRAFVECRAEASDNGRKIRGYAIVFNSLSQDLGGFKERIDPAAVDRTLSEGLDVRALVNHDTSLVIGRTRAGTLQLRKDSRGLAFVIEPDEEISYAKDIMRAVARGDVSGMSFGFRTLEDTWDYETEPWTRTVNDMKVSEISICSFPAYTQTDVTVAQRSMNAARAVMTGRSVAFLRRLHRARLAR